MKTFVALIQGTTSFLMHRFSESAEGAVGAQTRTVKVGGERVPREEAQRVAYQNPAGDFYFPGAAFSRMLREAGGGHKIKGSRKSAKYVVPSAVLVLDDAVFVLDGTGEKAKTFEVDSRPVVIPATKGRVMRHRPRFDAWGMRVTIRINDAILEPKFVRQLFEEGGRQIGIGDFRPEKGGPFGTFEIMRWDEIGQV